MNRIEIKMLLSISGSFIGNSDGERRSANSSLLKYSLVVIYLVLIFRNITYGITKIRRQELGLILQTVCCGELNLCRVSVCDNI